MRLTIRMMKKTVWCLAMVGLLFFESCFDKKCSGHLINDNRYAIQAVELNSVSLSGAFPKVQVDSKVLHKDSVFFFLGLQEKVVAINELNRKNFGGYTLRACSPVVIDSTKHIEYIAKLSFVATNDLAGIYSVGDTLNQDISQYLVNPNRLGYSLKYFNDRQNVPISDYFKLILPKTLQKGNHVFTVKAVATSQLGNVFEDSTVLVFEGK